jgi:hypothetical protein
MPVGVLKPLASVVTAQATGEAVGVGVGEMRGVGLSVPELEGRGEEVALGVVLGEAPRERAALALKEAVGLAEGADTNCTLATKPLSCTSTSVVKTTVRLLPALVQLPSAAPECPDTSTG